MMLAMRLSLPASRGEFSRQCLVFCLLNNILPSRADANSCFPSEVVCGAIFYNTLHFYRLKLCDMMNVVQQGA
jgi:hypothetical protein